MSKRFQINCIACLAALALLMPAISYAGPHIHSTSLKKSQVNKLLSLKVGESAILDVTTAAGKARLIIKRKRNRSNPKQLKDGTPQINSLTSRPKLFSGYRAPRRF